MGKTKNPRGIKVVSAIVGILISSIMFSLFSLLSYVAFLPLIVYLIILGFLRGKYENKNQFGYYMTHYALIYSGALLIITVILAALFALGIFSTVKVS